ncbi:MULTISPECIES: universal stress protein [Streptomyces]|uniref:Universal stress protein n=1 Tax=Streptomyces virginiae TaxID=1961 RepID=A0ABQ3NID5_STRVG|nr:MULTISPECIES: universal stress protein [Streptomyces]GLV88850.1 universal stress protein [Streptomyces lavendulae subsp. lavendulae]MBP2347749.1 nucleotide-binding universal stress UspA family protein [Streptomyces virginiae]MCI4086021.1 universal stress protein [Streptomyces sp. MMS21 TC-5]QNE24233.1 universal stress protein [Streptomyces sp. INR7]GGQ03914.1 universal stress protein [Streptomyces virginiae]
MSEDTVEPLIVVGVDGSDHSKEAVRWAVEQARLIGGRVHAVMAWEWNRNPFAIGMAEAQLAEQEAVTAEEAARRKLADTVNAAVGASPGVPVFRRVEQGSPAQVLVDASKEADLTVVGTRGYGGFKGALLGSVSQQVVQYSAGTVVVVRESEDEGGD